MEEIFHPKSIAVVGATANYYGGMPNFAAALFDYGYQGKIYLVNPKYSEILGRKAYPSLKEVPGSIDYVISCIPASEVLGMLKDCPQKGVKAVNLFTARFSETGRPEATELEQEILKEAKKHGIRLIGPNCIGLYDPYQGISMADDLPRKPGSVALLSQSGGVLRQIPATAALRGVYFSKGISYGNAIDLNECDLLDYVAHDPETKIIMMYIEGVKDGRRFFKTLRQAASTKPVIITKGGRGNAGTRSASSHTASLAGSMRIWETLVAQTGAIPAESTDEMIDLAVAFYFLPPIYGYKVGVVGAGGGGASVLAADECEEAGLDVIPLPAAIREELKSKGNKVWDWMGNPVDMSIDWGNTDFTNVDMLRLMAKNPDFDLLIAPIGAQIRRGQPGGPVDEHIKPYLQVANKPKPLLAVVTERSLGIPENDNLNWKQTYEIRAKLAAAGIPTYPTLGRAARAARKLIAYYQRKTSLGISGI